MSQNCDKNLSKSSYELFRNTLSQNNRFVLTCFLDFVSQSTPQNTLRIDQHLITNGVRDRDGPRAPPQDPPRSIFRRIWGALVEYVLALFLHRFVFFVVSKVTEPLSYNCHRDGKALFGSGLSPQDSFPVTTKCEIKTMCVNIAVENRFALM